MRPDTLREHDTWSPWYEAFTPHTQAGERTLASAVEADAPAEASTPIEAAEPDPAIQALFDCYNG
jgi:hypothetical protein